MTDSSLFVRGTLFTRGFLQEAIERTPVWDDADTASFEIELRRIFEAFPDQHEPNETQTEDDLIWPVLKALGWSEFLRQQNLAVRGRDDVPDGLLFADADAKARANRHPDEWRRYTHGVAMMESKRWDRPLDRRSGQPGENLAPSNQMLRYLRRVEDLTDGGVRWGILTNGARWRLYFQGAQSVAEQFLEIDLAAVLGIRRDLFSTADDEETRAARAHWLKVFLLMFRREAFLVTPGETRTFHQHALDEGKFYEERVTKNLSKLVFEQVFPDLVRALSSSVPDASTEEVREGALILLYRLLFLLYAEDRDLLPVKDHRYDDYGLRDHVRRDVGRRMDMGDTFAAEASTYWDRVRGLCRMIDRGAASIGLPPYNGGLFDTDKTPILDRAWIGDDVMARTMDALSFEREDGIRRYINYRDLSVQQLGSIYERLLEFELVEEAGELVIRPNPFARKSSGSYYTPEELVNLIIQETIEPLIADRMEAFLARAEELAEDNRPVDERLAALKRIDPASKILELKVCDPAMGSGHFLVSLVDYLSDRVMTTIAECETAITWGEYSSPLVARIADIRSTIIHNAEESGWALDVSHLDDRHVIRRMVLKRCVYGVDKNPMAVELAKVSLWLHTFTVGAPLSFLDHHLRCGDSLFGLWVHRGMRRLAEWGDKLFLHDALQRAVGSASVMQAIEGLTDVEIAEAHRSADMFAGIVDMTSELDQFLHVLHALDWLHIRDNGDRTAVQAWIDGKFGDPIAIVRGRQKHWNEAPEAPRFREILDKAQALIAEERFFNWQVGFPGVWSDWETDEHRDGFDAVIGNPPWDRIKMQQVEWFAARQRSIAMAPRAADRVRMTEELIGTDDPLARAYEKAVARAERMADMARFDRRNGGDYPLLSGGDINLYSLFVERAFALVRPEGMVGVLTPSGIASDKTASNFFKGMATGSHLKCLYDFENRRTRYDKDPFFPDVDSRFKFCTLVGSPQRVFDQSRCAFFLQDVSELEDGDRCFGLDAADFANVNPNTGTAPVFRSSRDADITRSIYRRLPVLVDRSGTTEQRAWPVRYLRMFDMTNDSHLFETRQSLEERFGAWPTGGNYFQSEDGEWVPLYEGKMVQAFDHRASSVRVNPENQHRPAQPVPATEAEHQQPAWVPEPQYWVREADCGHPPERGWVVGFKEITSPTNVRTLISAVLPAVGFGNKVPIWRPERLDANEWLLVGNFNAVVLDYITRQKIHGQTLNLYIMEQLPVVPPARYEEITFGNKTAFEVVREAVLELTYTSHDMAPFAQNMGYVDASGEVKPPFPWDEERRLHVRAKLDALYFILYGVFNPNRLQESRDDIRHIYSTFPIVERDEIARYGSYRSCELCLAYANALSSGEPDAVVAA
jgi:hypothetical protein